MCADKNTHYLHHCPLLVLTTTPQNEIFFLFLADFVQNDELQQNMLCGDCGDKTDGHEEQQRSAQIFRGSFVCYLST